MKPRYRLLLSSACAAALLSACGGGFSIGFWDDDDDRFFDLEPYPSGRSASLVISAASNAALDGTYRSNNTWLSNVVRLGDPETCRFIFDGLRETDSGRFLAGEVRYRPGDRTVVTSFVDFAFQSYRLGGDAGVRLDEATSTVVYNGAVLTSMRGTGQTITLTGSVPLRRDRPGGC